MPRGPKGQKRPADVIGNAVHVMRIATGKIEDTTEADDGKDPAARALGKKGGEAEPRGAGRDRQEGGGETVGKVASNQPRCDFACYDVADGPCAC